MSVVRIGTRTSPLAMAQSRYVAQLLRERDPNLEVEIVGISTRGDRDQDPYLWRRPDTGGIGFFVAEVEKALLDGRCDIAVHSLKDLPTGGTPGLVVAATPPREDPCDILVLPIGGEAGKAPGEELGEAVEAPGGAAQAAPLRAESTHDVAAVVHALPAGSRIGTASPRRERQMLQMRPDLELIPVRGNVETRLKKLDSGEYDAIILAAAGIARLGIDRPNMHRIPPELMVPAPGQGALGVQCRADDDHLVERLGAISDPATHLAVACERAFLAAVEGGCRLPVGAHVRALNAEANRFELLVFVGPEEPDAASELDRSERFESELRSLEEAIAFGQEIGLQLRGGATR